MRISAASCIALAGACASTALADIQYVFDGTFTSAGPSNWITSDNNPAVSDTIHIELTLDETMTGGLDPFFPEYTEAAFASLLIEFSGNTYTAAASGSSLDIGTAGGNSSMTLSFVIVPGASVNLFFPNGIGHVTTTPYPEQAFFDAANPGTFNLGVFGPPAGAGTLTGGIAIACFADCDASGALNVDDIDCFVTGFIGSDLAAADCDGNGALNVDDIDCFVTSFLSGCP